MEGAGISVKLEIFSSYFHSISGGGGNVGIADGCINSREMLFRTGFRLRKSAAAAVGSPTISAVKRKCWNALMANLGKHLCIKVCLRVRFRDLVNSCGSLFNSCNFVRMIY